MRRKTYPTQHAGRASQSRWSTLLSSLVLFLAFAAVSCGGNDNKDSTVNRDFPEQAQEPVTLVAPIQTNVLPRDTEGRNIAATTWDIASDQLQSVTVEDGPPLGGNSLVEEGVESLAMRGSIPMGGWWPFKGQTFVRLVQLRIRSDGGEVAFGRQVPATLSAPDHRVFLEGMSVWVGPNLTNAEYGFDLLALREDQAQIDNHSGTVQVVRPGDMIRHANGAAWKVIALHPASGELPACMEAKLIQP